MTERERNIQFIIDSIWHLEDATVGKAYFEDWTDEEIEEEAEWYEYLWTK